MKDRNIAPVPTIRIDCYGNETILEMNGNRAMSGVEAIEFRVDARNGERRPKLKILVDVKDFVLRPSERG